METKKIPWSIGDGYLYISQVASDNNIATLQIQTDANTSSADRQYTLVLSAAGGTISAEIIILQKGNTPSSYSLIVVPSDSKISITSGGGTFDEVTAVKIGAVSLYPMQYKFVNWSDGDTNQFRTVTVDQSQVLTANFTSYQLQPTYQENPYSDKIHILADPFISVYTDFGGSSQGQAIMYPYIIGMATATTFAVRRIDDVKWRPTANTSNWGVKRFEGQLPYISNYSSSSTTPATETPLDFHNGCINFSWQRYSEEDEFPLLYISGNPACSFQIEDKATGQITDTQLPTGYVLDAGSTRKFRSIPFFVYRITRNNNTFTYQHIQTLNYNGAGWSELLPYDGYFYIRSDNHLYKVDAEDFETPVIYRSNFATTNLADVTLELPTSFELASPQSSTIYKDTLFTVYGQPSDVRNYPKSKYALCAWNIHTGKLLMAYNIKNDFTTATQYWKSDGTYSTVAQSSFLEQEAVMIHDNKVFIALRSALIYIADLNL